MLLSFIYDKIGVCSVMIYRRPIQPVLKVGVTVDAGRCMSCFDEGGKDSVEEYSSCLDDRKG